MHKVKTIGMIGGLGWESSATYYRAMNREVRLRCGGYHSARIVLDSLDFHSFAVASTPEDFKGLRRQLVDSGRRLEAAGAEVILIACNTLHRFAQSVVDELEVPFLHIGDSLGEALRRDGHRKVALLGTRATMESAFYKKRLARFDVDVVVPDRSRRVELNELILHELNSGGEPQACARRLDEMVADLKSQGASAAALACTELGLAYGGQDEPVIQRALPAYDTALIHAHAAVQASLGSAARRHVHER